MRTLKVVSIPCMLLLLSGCAAVISVHPLAGPDDKDAVFDPALVGTWEDVDTPGNGAGTRFNVTGHDSAYSVTVDGDGTTYTMRLLKVGGRYLLDVDCPSDGPSPPVHMFLKLRRQNDTAWVASMDSQWLMEQIKTRGQPRHETLEEDSHRILLTASPTELREFLLPYAGDDRAFSDEGQLRRVK